MDDSVVMQDSSVCNVDTWRVLYHSRRHTECDDIDSAVTRRGYCLSCFIYRYSVTVLWAGGGQVSFHFMGALVAVVIGQLCLTAWFMVYHWSTADL